jgi:hypothetical protein
MILIPALALGQLPDSVRRHMDADALRLWDLRVADSLRIEKQIKDSIAAVKGTSPGQPGATVDTTSLSNRINRKADSTDNASRTFTNATYLKNADSTDKATRTFTNATYLKNADSTDKATRTFTGATYATKASPVFSGFLGGSSTIRGTAAFTTTGTRLAIYIPGATANDFPLVSIKMATAPSAVDTRLGLTMKTDSLIVIRPASGTSGEAIYWLLAR